MKALQQEHARGARSRVVDRPLWQILLPLMLVGLAVQRAAVGTALFAGELGSVIVVAYVLQGLAAVAAAVGVWLGRRWTVGALLTLGAMLIASALLEGFWLGVRPPLASVGEILIVTLSTGALVLVLRRELDETERA